MGVALGFDSAGIAPSAGMPPPIPLAEYNVMITDSGKEDTADKTGAYLFVDLKIMDGPLAGRTQTDRMNLWNKNAQTVEIAQGRLSAYCIITKKFRFANTEELHGIPFKAVIGPQIEKEGVDKGKPSDKYSEVKELKNADGSRPALVGSAGAPAPSGASPLASAAPPPPAAAPSFGPPVIAAQQPPPPPPVADPSASWQRSPDGNYKLNPATNAWEANTAPATPPPPAVPAFGAPPAPAPTGGKPPWTA